MSTRIPLPGNMIDTLMKGVDTGSNMYKGIMHPILQREINKQKAEQFTQQQSQLENHFQQNFGLSKANASRMAQVAADNHKIAMNKLDPTYQAKQYEALENYFKNKGNVGGQQSNPQMQEAQQETGEGLGAFTPQGMQEAQQQPQMPQGGLMGGQGNNTGGVDLELMKQHPMLRGAFKKFAGYDPLANDKANSYQGSAREAYDLQRLKNEFGENSQVYQDAKEEHEAKIDAKKDLRDLRARTKGGLKAGERWISDPETGAPVGKEIPLTAKEREEYRGRGFFNYAFPVVSKGLSEITGPGSIGKYSEAAANYKSNPKAKELLINYYLGKKLLPALTAKEAQTLQTGKQKNVIQALESGLDSSDIPKKIDSLVKQFNIGSDIKREVDKRFLNELNKATKAGNKAVPAFQKQYFDPEKQEQESQVNDLPEEESKTVIVIDPTGKRFETTEENAVHLPKGWKRG